MQTDQTVALRFPIRTRPAGEITERYRLGFTFYAQLFLNRWLGSRVVSVLDSGAEGPGFKSQSRRCRVTV